MKSQLTNFNYGVAQIRTITDKDVLWFVAKDVCLALNIKWFGNKSLQSIPSHWKGIGKLPTPSESPDNRGGGVQEVLVINESGLYKLAFRSNKAEATRFTDWVAGEVLPSIRKYGKYEVKQSIENDYRILSFPANIARISYTMKKQMEEEHSYPDRLNMLYQFYATMQLQVFHLENFINKLVTEERKRLKVDPAWTLEDEFEDRL